MRPLLAVLVLPFTVTVVVPALLLRAWNGLPFAPALWLRLLGGLLLLAGLSLVVWTIRLFAHYGQGTLAPWDPPRHLVVRGPYRHVRNPMITGVGLVLLGEAALFGSLLLLAGLGLFAVINAVYTPLSEEPGLRRRFGAEYDNYCRHVPRWLPRLTPWPAIEEPHAH
jgi:protein-S-isoprenylcysteine O-methyltransferase Ste14